MTMTANTLYIRRGLPTLMTAARTKRTFIVTALLGSEAEVLTLELIYLVLGWETSGVLIGPANDPSFLTSCHNTMYISVVVVAC